MTTLRLPDGVRLPALFAYEHAGGVRVVVVADAPDWRTVALLPGGPAPSAGAVFEAMVAGGLRAQGDDEGFDVRLVPLPDHPCLRRRRPAGTTP